MELNNWIDTFQNECDWTFINGFSNVPAIPLLFPTLHKAGKYLASSNYFGWSLFRSFGRSLDENMTEKIQCAITQKNFEANFQEKISGELMWRAFAYMQDKYAYPDQIKMLEATLDYIVNMYNLYGPFDGIVGMCEGAAIAGLFMQQLQKNKIKLKNNKLRFLVSMSGWKSDNTEIETTYYKDTSKLSFPSLHFCGSEDSQYAQHLF